MVDRALLSILCCPQSLTSLCEVDEGLLSVATNTTYPVIQGVPVFGVRAEKSDQRLAEIKAQIQWMGGRESHAGHLKYAQEELNNHRLLNPLFRILHSEVIRTRNPWCLDLGSGAGIYTHLAGHLGGNWVAVDPFPEIILSATSLANDREKPFHRIISDASLLPFHSSSFDVLLCKDSFHHNPTPKWVIAEMHRVTRPGGMIILVEPIIPYSAMKGTGGTACRGGTENRYSILQYLRWMLSICFPVKLMMFPHTGNPKKGRYKAGLVETVRNYLDLSFRTEGEIILAGRRRKRLLPFRDQNRQLVPIACQAENLDLELMDYLEKQLLPELLQIADSAYHSLKIV